MMYARDFVVEVVREHATTLLVIARRYSLCADDAYQRALEIFLRRAPEVERATAVAWLRTVVKHEALAVRAARQTSVNSGEVDLDLQEARRLPSEDEQVLRFDRVTRAAEALQRLKPHEITALVLKAEGHTYQEICDHTGWSYTNTWRQFDPPWPLAQIGFSSSVRRQSVAGGAVSARRVSD